MKLYYWPKTRAFRALWMLEELRVPYEFALVNIRAGDQNEPAFCRGQSDVEVARTRRRRRDASPNRARCCSISPINIPQARLGVPLDDPLRGRFLQWMFFTGACLEPAMAERMTGAPGNSVSFGWGDLGRVEQAIESALEDGPWLVGERFTAADILVVEHAADCVYGEADRTGRRAVGLCRSCGRTRGARTRGGDRSTGGASGVAAASHQQTGR